MGFKSLLESQVQNAMTILGQDDGLAPNIDYISSGTRSYDTTTRTYSSVDQTFNNVPAVLARFEEDEMDEEVIVASDFKCLIAALDLSVTPKGQDKLTVLSGIKAGTYSVHRLLSVPGDSLYILHVRKV